MTITLFKNIHETSTPYHLKITDVLYRIKSGASKDLIESIRTETDKAKRNDLKKNLPSICFSGTFRERKASKLIKHSGIVCLDFDDFKSNEDLEDFKIAMCEDKYVYSCFISPSGKGLKALVKIPTIVHNHKRYFEALQDYFDTPHFDISGSDVSRVCYESYDKDLYLNEESQQFNEILDTKEFLQYDINNVKLPIKNDNEKIKRLDKWWNKNFGFNDGERNANIFKLACAFSEYGINQYTCEQHFSQYQQEDFSLTEIKRTIQSAYQKTKHNFDTKYFEDNQITDYVNRKYLTGESEESIKKELQVKGFTDDEVEAVINEAKENESIEVFWTKSSKGRVTIISKKLKDYLKQQGFYKYYPEGSENFVFVKIKSNLIENTTEDKIKNFVLQELEANEQYDVFEYLAVNTRYFKEDYLNILGPISVAMKQDTRDKSYCYYNNCAVEVTTKGINILDYVSLDGFVWKDQVIDRPFELLESYDNDFRSFLFNISGKNDLSLKAFESTLGYLIHSYKNKGYSPAVILNDEVISENPEGGTGKGLLINSVAQLKRTVVLDGKSFDKGKAFAYQTVSASTQTLVFDDVKKNFDFEGLFSLITEGITLEKKNKDAIKLDFYSSPKIVITTNYAIAGKGNSHDRRKWELELAQHYNLQLTPLDDFGKLLFDDWNEQEWLKFDNYMLQNLRKFLKDGFVQADFKNLDTRKFISETCFEFYEWVQDEETSLLRKDRISKNDAFEEFTNTYSDYKKWLTKKKFNVWLKSWAKFRDVKFEEGNTNGIRWITFLDGSLQEELIEEIEF